MASAAETGHGKVATLPGDDAQRFPCAVRVSLRLCVGVPMRPSFTLVTTEWNNYGVEVIPLSSAVLFLRHFRVFARSAVTCVCVCVHVCVSCVCVHMCVHAQLVTVGSDDAAAGRAVRVLNPSSDYIPPELVSTSPPRLQCRVYVPLLCVCAPV